MNPEHVAVVKQGAAAIAKWRAENLGVRLDLSGADLHSMDLRQLNLEGSILTGANLIGANLNHAVLSSVDLTSANLSDAVLGEADLRRANLAEADLKGAVLILADLRGADLSGADLSRALLMAANLSRANLSDVDFTEAKCGTTTSGSINLSSVKGLGTMHHTGPSTLGIDTLYLSNGKIPVAFLRGCGVPEEFITYLPALIGAQQAIQFYSCFISYSHKDEEFARRLYGRLQQAGLRVWYAPEEMKGGRKLHELIDEGIRLHDKLLLVLSEESLASEWVATEIRKARKAERKEGRQKLFPIRLVPFDPHIKEWECFDADSGKDLGVELREYFMPDFQNWKDHDAFEAGMVRLLKDLRAEEAGTTRPI